MAYPVVEIIAGRKLCSRCGETKPTRAFVRSHTVECGLNSTCRMCDPHPAWEFRRRRLCWVCCSPLRRRSNGRSTLLPALRGRTTRQVRPPKGSGVVHRLCGTSRTGRSTVHSLLCDPPPTTSAVLA